MDGTRIDYGYLPQTARMLPLTGSRASLRPGHQEKVKNVVNKYCISWACRRTKHCEELPDPQLSRCDWRQIYQREEDMA